MSDLPPSSQILDELLAREFGASYEDLTGSLPRHATLRYAERSVVGIDRMVLHHTEASRATSWQAVAQYHVATNGWPGIGYHLGIRRYADQVLVSQLNMPHVQSYHAHAVGNQHGLAVCIAGKFDTTTPYPDEAEALRLVVAVVRRWATWAPAMPIVAHGDVPGNDTTCPGQYLRAILPALNTSPTLHEAILSEAERQQVMQFNPDAALQRAIFTAGYTPNSPEFEIEHGEKRYAAQRAEHLASGVVRVYYAQMGDWGNVRFVER